MINDSVSSVIFDSEHCIKYITRERERGGGGGGEGGRRRKHIIVRIKKITKNLLSFSSKCEKSIFLAIAFSSAEVVL